MAGSRASHHRVKTHLPYNVDEAARAVGKHRNTVLAWIKAGLETVDGKKPYLIKGAVLAAFVKAKRSKNKQQCGPGRLYCLRCRQAQRPALGMADIKVLTGTLGDLVGLCPVCETLMHRRVNLRRLVAALGDLDVSTTLASTHIVDTSQTSLNCDFHPRRETYEKSVQFEGPEAGHATGEPA